MFDADLVNRVLSRQFAVEIDMIHNPHNVMTVHTSVLTNCQTSGCDTTHDSPAT